MGYLATTSSILLQCILFIEMKKRNSHAFIAKAAGSVGLPHRLERAG